MRIIYVFLIIFLSTKITYAGLEGKGDLQLSDNTVNSFIRYIKGGTSKGKAGINKPLDFWVSSDGNHAAWWYCPFDRCLASNGVEEKKACEKGTQYDCSRFAKGRYVRWANGINPKGKKAKFSSKMTDNEIKSKLTSLGFYKNNNSSLSKEENFNSSTIVNNSENLTLDERLQNLSNLFKDGLLTEEEFKSAKKRLLE